MNENERLEFEKLKKQIDGMHSSKDKGKFLDK